MNKYKKAFIKTIKGIKDFLPLLIAILLLISIIKTLGVFDYLNTYIENSFLGVFITDLVGSISAGNAINSYIIANSIGNFNENMLIITVFLISWVTVGIIQIPVEIKYFGKKFTIIRNIISFIFAIIGAYLIYFLMNI